MTGNHPSRLRAQRHRWRMREADEEASLPNGAISIVKVQQPLAVFGPDAKAEILIYDKDRIHQTLQPRTHDLDVKLGRDPKGFFEAAWSEVDNQWTLGMRVRDQGW